MMNDDDVDGTHSEHKIYTVCSSYPAVSLSMSVLAVFWNVTLYCFLDKHQNMRGYCCFRNVFVSAELHGVTSQKAVV